jgi:hypothetical protein
MIAIKKEVQYHMSGEPEFELIYQRPMDSLEWSYVPSNCTVLQGSWKSQLREDAQWVHTPRDPQGPMADDMRWEFAFFPRVIEQDPDDLFYGYWKEADVYVYDCFNHSENVGYCFLFTSDIHEDGGEIREEVVEFCQQCIVPIVRIRSTTNSLTRQVTFHYS